MKIRRDSWHYRFLLNCWDPDESELPKNSCTYWPTVAFTAVCLVVMVPFLPAVWAWRRFCSPIEYVDREDLPSKS